MATFYFSQTHTFASALRAALERNASEEDYVSCTVMHPLDNHVEVCAPSEAFVREALLDVKRCVAENRARLSHRS